MHTRFGLRAVGALLALASLTALGACGRQATMLAVNASATTRSAPDLAIVTLGVLARGSSAQAAQQAQAERMNAVMAAARAAGAAQDDVQTVGYSLDPQYAYPRGQAPRITGYTSRNTVSIRLSALDKVSSLIDATVAEGANELQGIEFTYRDTEASREAARAQALQAARTRAETYARAANMHVARITSIVEPGASLPPADGGARDLFAPQRVSVEQAASANAIAPGQLDNLASLTVVFELR